MVRRRVDLPVGVYIEMLFKQLGYINWAIGCSPIVIVIVVIVIGWCSPIVIGLLV